MTLLRFLFILSWLPLGGVTYLEPEAFFQQVHSEPSVIVLDVRSFIEYREGHIEGAFWAGEAKVLEEILETHEPKEGIYIYCAQGDRTRTVRKILRKRGYKTVYELKDGFNNWIEQGFPVFHP